MADFKAEGNACFKARQFSEACDWYTKAIAADGSNAILYSNRSGAYYELKQYDRAIADARKSLELSPTPKGHSRMGAAYWAQNRLDLALECYEKSLALAPTDANTRDNVAQLKAKIQRGAGGRQQAAPPALAGEKVDAGLDLAILSVTLLQVVGSIVMPQYAILLWKLLLACMVGRSALILRRQGLLQPQMEALKGMVNQFAGQYLLLCIVLIFVPIQPLPTIMGAIALYAIVDLACSQRGAAVALMPMLDRLVGTRLDTVRQNRDGLLINAAMCEIAAAFIAVFTGNFMYGMLLLQFFLKFRYRNDSYAQFAWGYLGQTLGKVFYHAKCPPMATNLFEKVKLGMHTMATR